MKTLRLTRSFVRYLFMNSAIRLLCVGLLTASVGHTSENESMHSSCSDNSESAVIARPLKLLTLNVSHGRSTAINQILTVSSPGAGYRLSACATV